MKFGRSEHGLATGVSLGAMSLGLVLWLWPIGFGGQMPVGGDVTQFSLGLMAFLRDSLHSVQLPVWNDLWGYGFPGLGESQMGVYYPPHWVIYGLLPLEWAYTASLVLHTLLGGGGTFWAARRFGASVVGAGLAGFAWSTSGFYLIHLPHQWGYTVGSWMPWAWGLAWQVVRREGTWRSPFLLSLVLVLQLLPGHFQLAFYTEVGVLLLSLAGLEQGRSGWRPIVQIVMAMLAVAPLAALQLVPTARLAFLASSTRNFEYLSGFAATPLHLVSYVAPGLFHGSPLWRPLAWDLFHTSPEEYLGYIGLVPLYFALVATLRRSRTDPPTRALVLVVVVTCLLSFGPYVPGFRYLIKIPGFSFFRASARWSLATGLALSLLAAKGYDSWQDWRWARSSLAWFAGLAGVAPLLVLIGLELVLANSPPSPTEPGILAHGNRILNSLSVESVFAERTGGVDLARTSSFEQLRADARRPQDDLRVQTALARQNRPWRTAKDRTFEPMRFSIYRQELILSSSLIVALLVIASCAGRLRFSIAALLALTVIDLCLVGRQRPTDLGPIRPLVEQSPVLARLAGEQRGTRTVDSLRNMPMVAGAAPISAYRTLDLPCATELTSLARAPLGEPGRDGFIAEALRTCGVGVRVLDPLELLSPPEEASPSPDWEVRETVQDVALAGWLYSADWVAQQGPRAATFRLLTPRSPASGAWLVPLTDKSRLEILETPETPAEVLLETVRRATPITVERSSPTQLKATIDVSGPAVVVLSQLADPQWRARWVGSDGEREAIIRPIFVRWNELGWQAVEAPGSGPWTLRLEYVARDVQLGLGVSIIAGILGVLFYFITSRTAHSTRGH